MRGPHDTPLVDFRPATVSVLVRWLAASLPLVALWVVLWIGQPAPWEQWGRAVTWVTVSAMMAQWAWLCVSWWATSYRLYADRAESAWGVLRRVRVVMPLSRVQDAWVTRSLVQRLVGIGTVGVSTAGGPGAELVWRDVSDPHGVLDELRRRSSESAGMSGGAR